MSKQASISGFTFIRNGVMLGFPFVESIRSLLPLVDEFVVAVGRSDDDTLARVQAIGDPKIKIIETVWNDHMADRGFVYAQQKMIAQYACTGDWAFYLEGDEVVHEASWPPSAPAWTATTATRPWRRWCLTTCTSTARRAMCRSAPAGTGANAG
jgi:hypothetical protein